MNIIVFSDSRSISEKFTGAARKSGPSAIQFYPRRGMNAVLKEMEKPAVVYLDVSGYTDSQRLKAVGSVLGIKGIACGVMDPKGAVKDVGELFHMGVGDYIGREVFRGGVSLKRIRRIIDFKALGAERAAGPAEKKRGAEYILSGDGWENVEPGREYTFAFMFIELDHQKELRRHLGEARTGKAVETFRNYIENRLAPLGGKIWMWTDFGGLVLFPFNGMKCDAIVAAMRLMLSRKIMGVEESGFNSLLSYRIAMHLGNTVFKSRGDTGSLVSDSINSIFHLGQKFTGPGDFCLTDELFSYAHKGVKKMFLAAGSYEGREILRMRRPL